MVRSNKFVAYMLGVVAVGGVLAAGCGGGGTSSGTAPAGDAQIPAGAPFMDQNGLTFSPDKITAKAGEKVYFKNSESSIHTVTINGKNESGNMKRDMVFAWTPPLAGTYKITCEFHAQMRATIVVQ